MRDERREQKSPFGPRGRHGGPPMGMPVEKPKNFKGTMRRLLSYLKPYKMKFIAVIFIAVLSTVFNIASPKIMGYATTKLSEGVMMKINGVPGANIDFDYILRIIVILCVLYVFSALFLYIQQYIMVDISQETVYQMRKDVKNKLTRLPLKFYDSRTHGEILSRVTNDVDNISTTLQQSSTQLIRSVITIIGILIMMITISPLMTLIALVTLPLSFLVTAIVAKHSQKQFKGQQKALGELNGHVEEMYTGHSIVKVFNHEKKSISKFEEINKKLYDTGWKAQFVSGIIMPLITLISNIGYVFICVVGGVLVTKGTINIGDIQAFIQYIKRFTMPIIQTANIANILQSTVASAERVFELLDEEEEIMDNENNITLESPKGNIRFENVRFGYKEDVILMNNMSIDVKQGQTIAVVGPTGAGKTTLVNLLMRFYEISNGQITVDGLNINEMKRGELRSIFGMVLQDTWLFNGTIRDNIAYGRLDATEEEIIEVADAAYADHFVRTLPDGYDTILNEEASNISQGQKQLITIARAILSNPAILILDEATSSVDTRTEVLIQKAMNKLMDGRTSFVIAHRLSTIRNADLILVMNEGNIIEKGSHSELIDLKGFYADLYNSQFTSTGLQDKAI